MFGKLFKQKKSKKHESSEEEIETEELESSISTDPEITISQYYKELVDSESEETIGKTRSGLSYLNLEIAQPRKTLKMGNEDNNPTTSGNVAGNTSQGTNSTVTFLPPLHKIRPFIGGQDGYDIASFLRTCADSIKTNKIQSDSDKIAYTRANISATGPSGDIMRARVFNNPADLIYYDVFCSNLSKMFGSSQLGGNLSWILRMVENQKEFPEGLPVNRALGEAGKIVADAYDTLAGSPWLVGDRMTGDQFYQILEYQNFLSLITPADRVEAHKHDIRPNETMVDYIIRVFPKRPQNSTQRAIPVAPVNPPNDPSKQNKNYVQATTGAVPKRKIPYCKICKKKGHSYEKCWHNKANVGVEKQTSPQYQKQGKPAQPSQDPGQPTTQRGPEKWCMIHQVKSHNTDDCSFTKQSRARYEKQRQETQSSGEASRAPPPGGT